MSDLFRQRYSPGVERLAAFIFFPSSVMWAAAQIRAFGHVLSASSELELEWAIAIAAAIVILYTVTGGLLADAMTDVIQGIALIIGLILLSGVLLWHGVPVASPWTAHAAAETAPAADWRSWLEWCDEWAVPIFGSVVAQELISRVIATRSARIARNTTLIAAGLYLAIGALPLYIGLAGATILPGLDDPEQVMPLLAQRYLPTVLYVLYAGALVSAILSTVDSALLAASALVSHNIVASFLPQMTDRAKLRMARIGVVVLGLVAYVLAVKGTRTYEMVEHASAMGSAGILVILTFGLFTRWGQAYSAWAALLVGTGVWIVGAYLLEFPGLYLGSVVAAASAYLLVATIESPIRSRFLRADTAR
jgi:Na+/proline symporter